MEIKRIDHYSIRTTDVEASRRFYTEIIGLAEGPRPEFKFPGLWLYNGKPPADLDHSNGNYGIVHVMGIDPDDPQGLIDTVGYVDPETLKGGTGSLDHIALSVTGRDSIVARLKKAGLKYFERSVPTLGLHQMFLKDPSGVMIELNFPASEAPKEKDAATAEAFR